MELVNLGSPWFSGVDPVGTFFGLFPVPAFKRYGRLLGSLHGFGKTSPPVFDCDSPVLLKTKKVLLPLNTWPAWRMFEQWGSVDSGDATNPFLAGMRLKRQEALKRLVNPDEHGVRKGGSHGVSSKDSLVDAGRGAKT